MAATASDGTRLRRPRTPKGRAREVARRLALEYPDARCELDFENPFQLLAATILSAQTTDVRVNMVTPVLFARYPDAEALAGAQPSELEEIVRSTGFYRPVSRTSSRCRGWAARPGTSCAASPSTCPACRSTPTWAGSAAAWG
jgi:endonuclease-3